MKRIIISLNANGEGTLECVGLGTYQCLGNPSMDYPDDVTVTGVVGTDKFQERFSEEFQVTMKWAVLLGWQRGLFIHEGADSIAENGGVSAGCIHLAEPNAKTVYDWVDGKTRITTTVVRPSAHVPMSFSSKLLTMMQDKAVAGLNLATSLPTLVTVAVFAIVYTYGLKGGNVSDIAFSRGLISIVFASGTIAIALALAVSTLFPTRAGDGSKERFERGREVLTILVGIFGTILGFYFGSMDSSNAGPVIYSVSPTSIEAGKTSEISVLGRHLGSADLFLIGDTPVQGEAKGNGQISLPIADNFDFDEEMVSIRAIETSAGRISNPFFLKIKQPTSSPEPAAPPTPGPEG